MLIMPEYKIIFIRPLKVAVTSFARALLSTIGADSEENRENYRNAMLKKCLNNPLHYDDLKDWSCPK